MVDGDDVSVAFDEAAGFDRRRRAHFTALAAASAAAAGCEPASTKLVPPDCHASTVPSCVESSCAVSPSSETVGSPESAPLWLPEAVGLSLDQHDAAEPLPVEGDGRVAADQADVAARQPDERRRRDDREVGGRLDGVEPGDRRRARCLPDGCGPVPRSTTFAPAGGEMSTSEDATAPYEMSVTASSSTGELLPCASIADPERHALHGVPGELDRPEQAAVVLRRDRNAVGGLPADVRRRRIGHRPVCAELGEELVDVRECGHGAAAGGLGRGVGRKIGAIDRVRRGVVDRDRLLIPEDLDVARVGLELDPAASVAR